MPNIKIIDEKIQIPVKEVGGRAIRKRGWGFPVRERGGGEMDIGGRIIIMKLSTRVDGLCVNCPFYRPAPFRFYRRLIKIPFYSFLRLLLVAFKINLLMTLRI